MAWTRSRRVMPGCISPVKRTSTDSGISSGMTPAAAAKATRPEPAGKEMPIGKRVCESPPVPTVSGSSMRLIHEWMMPSPGRSDTPPRFMMKSGSVCCVSTSTGLGYAAVWQKDCITRSAEKPRHARSFSSSRVMGPVVSCDPTVVIEGSQYCPGRTPWPAGSPHALPTIFCASVKPEPSSATVSGSRNTVDGSRPRRSRAFWVRPRPMMSGIRPPARTSSSRTSVLSENSAMTSSVPCRLATPA
mmetsp:Transcript_26110/g.68535  ORF Transcript_26110/g.68535 Transcript_26110/m.68535 type:complete len:245 (-) Transcript_26110:1065-1799(-)